MVHLVLYNLTPATGRKRMHKVGYVEEMGAGKGTRDHEV